MVKYYNLSHVYYHEKENIKEYEESATIFREISTVSDFLRAVIIIVNNYLRTGYSNPVIDRKENVLSKDIESYSVLSNEGLYFRGQSEIYQYTMPSLYRDFHYIKNENYIFDKMKINLHERFNSLQYSIDNLSIMQHYGLPTRIVDLTTNALTALFFACNGNLEKDGQVLLFKNFDIKDKEKPKQLLTSNHIETVTKANLVKLSFKEKVEMDKYIMNKTGDNPSYEDNEKIKKQYLNTFSDVSIFSKILKLIDSEIGELSEQVQVKHLYGLSFITPEKTDIRIVRQNGSFLLIGIDGYKEANQIFENEKNKIRETAQILFREFTNYHEKYCEEEYYNDVRNDESYETIDSYCDELGSLHKQTILNNFLIKFKEENELSESQMKFYDDILENNRQEIVFEENLNNIALQLQHCYIEAFKHEPYKKTINFLSSLVNNLIAEHEIHYQPNYLKDIHENLFVETIIDGSTDEHYPTRILIKSKYKEYLLKELNIIGLNASTLYSDMNSISDDIKKSVLNIYER